MSQIFVVVIPVTDCGSTQVLLLPIVVYTLTLWMLRCVIWSNVTKVNHVRIFQWNELKVCLLSPDVVDALRLCHGANTPLYYLITFISKCWPKPQTLKSRTYGSEDVVFSPHFLWGLFVIFHPKRSTNPCVVMKTSSAVFQVKWSDSSSSRVTKTHHELENFLLKVSTFIWSFLHSWIVWCLGFQWFWSSRLPVASKGSDHRVFWEEHSETSEPRGPVWEQGGGEQPQVGSLLLSCHSCTAFTCKPSAFLTFFAISLLWVLLVTS